MAAPEVAEHLAWPFRMGAKRLATVAQDSIEDVEQNVDSYFRTERGERSLSPDFGLEDPTFGPGVDVDALAADIEEAENGRAVVTIKADPVTSAGKQAVTVSVDLAE